MRHSLNFCAGKDRTVVATDLRLIYGAATADPAAAELDAFEENGPENIPHSTARQCIFTCTRGAPAWR